jgi:hypothetical protein
MYIVAMYAKNWTEIDPNQVHNGKTKMLFREKMKEQINLPGKSWVKSKTSTVKCKKDKMRKAEIIVIISTK